MQPSLRTQALQNPQPAEFERGGGEVMRGHFRDLAGEGTLWAGRFLPVQANISKQAGRNSELQQQSKKFGVETASKKCMTMSQCNSF